jgi:CO dehydrogenase/acetyl-CoA synthase delta subunit
MFNPFRSTLGFTDVVKSAIVGVYICRIAAIAGPSQLRIGLSSGDTNSYSHNNNGDEDKDTGDNTQTNADVGIS